MKWTVGTKIGSGFGLALAILASIGAVSYLSVTKLDDTADWVTHTHIVLERLGDLIQSLTDAETGQRGFFLTALDTYLEPYQASIAVADQRIKELRELTKDNPNQQHRLDQLEPLVAQRLSSLKEGIDIQKTKGTDALHTWLLAGVSKQQMDAVRKLVDDMKDEENTLLKKRVNEAQASSRGAKATILIGSLVAVIILFLAGLSITRNIARPLGEMTATADRLANGDLTVSTSVYRRSDEVGLLAQTFRRMIENLREQLIAMGKMANTLSSSATQISATTSQFTASATETAAAVTETTATVEEVRQTAQLASQKSKMVSETAQKVALTAQTGRKATEDTIEGIQRIRQQMDSIASSMTSLSQQTQAIGQIIASVDELAAQSNLLAVNASIEAAKAGEHGKGFAVVAQEVRSLAEQSKQATNQVRSLLSDIRKATSAAMLVIEQGSKAVEAGVKQSAEAGLSIQTLSGGVTEAAQTATQIAASSQQQQVGMDQVATAIENVKQASTQNVESARQLESAALNLQGVGRNLKQLIESYKV